MSLGQVMLETAPDVTAALPSVSAGLPVYNGERFVARALESLLAQDYPDFEIIVCDNASTDSTYAICLEYASRDPRIRVYRNEKNFGVQANFKKVLELAGGRYFFWAGVDDQWEPSFVRRLVEELEVHPEAALAMTAFDRVYEDGKRYDTQRFVGRASPNDKSCFEMALKLTSPLKFNLFLYGLFRREFVRRAVRVLPDIPAWDRVFMTMVCLSAPLRYVDEILHQHGLHTKTLKERYPEEAVFRRKGGKDYRSLFWRTVGSIARTTLRSDLVPWYRKTWLPVCLAHYGWEVVKHRVRSWAYGLFKLFKRCVFNPALTAVKAGLQEELTRTETALTGLGNLGSVRRGYLQAKRSGILSTWKAGKRVHLGLGALRRLLLPRKVRPEREGGSKP